MPKLHKHFNVIANPTTILKTFEEILIESDANVYPGEVFYNNYNDLSEISNQRDVFELINVGLEEAVRKNKINRFNFISFLLLAGDNDATHQRQIYMKMLAFAINHFDDRSEAENERLFELLLDLLWHQDKGLTKLNVEEQQRLSNFLKLSASINYEITEDGDAIYFAVKKAVDLITYQKEYGDTDGLIALFVHHFDDKIRKHTIEKMEKNWL